MIKKSITITDQQEEWIKSQMASGHYGTDSELIREALREKQLRMAEVEKIRALLIAGERSEISALTPEQILAKSKEQLERDGKL